MRSAPQNRLSLAISLINAIVSAEILGVADMALDLYFHQSLKPRRCQREPRLWLNNEESLFPGPHHAGQQDQKHAVRFGTGRSFDLSTQDDQRLSKKGIFCDQFGLTSGKVGQCAKQERGGIWFGPSDIAAVKRLKAMASQPLEKGENPLHGRRSPLVKISR